MLLLIHCLTLFVWVFVFVFGTCFVIQYLVLYSSCSTALLLVCSCCHVPVSVLCPFLALLELVCSV